LDLHKTAELHIKHVLLLVDLFDLSL